MQLSDTCLSPIHTFVSLILKKVLTPLTLTKLDNAGDYDDDEGRHLRVGENVLHKRAPLHVGTVDERQ